MRMNPKLSVFALGFLVSGPALRPAIAATATASFSVTARVLSGCQATPTSQGFKSNAAATTNAASTISVACTQPTPYVVSLGTEVAPDYNAAIAKAIDPGSALQGGAQPSLPQHAINRGRTVVAGTVAGVGSGSSQLRTVLNRTAAAEIPAPAAHPDAVMVTITY